MFLQIEFKRRQSCTKFVKFINKGMSGYIDSKAERCVWLNLRDVETRNKVRDILLKQVSKCELKYRDSGIDYLFVN
jgi:hypothetical protein